MGNVKTTITIDEDLWKQFTLLVIEKYGYRKKNQIIEKLIREFIKEHEFPLAYDAIWAFEEDILELKKNFKEHVLMAHLSQPLGKPLHKYIGELIIDENVLVLSGKNKETSVPSETLIPCERIREVFLGWDNVLRRWRDTRAWIHPLRIKFEENGKIKKVYIYAKKPEGKVYGRENKKILEKLKMLWNITANS